MSFKFISFDLETTGIVSKVDQIVEIGAVRFAGEQVESMFSTLVDPGCPIPTEASKVNKITNEMVVGKPKIESLLGPFTEFCGKDLMIAYNAPFDYQFLLNAYQKFESPPPQGPLLDILPLAKRVFPGLANPKLSTLVQYLKIQGQPFHRAEADALYCGLVFIEICKRIFSNAPFELARVTKLMGKSELRFPVIERKPKQLDLLGL
jgi:DNA polymerase-3 subunit epsilon